jgi:hypothetical protein
LVLVKPNRFYFSAADDVKNEVWGAYGRWLNELKEIFPGWGNLPERKKSTCATQWVYVTSCNGPGRRTEPFSPSNDMRLLSKASSTLARIISPAANGHGTDLSWAHAGLPTAAF